MAFSAVLVVGCAKSTDSAERDTLTADVARYSPPPAGIVQPRVGVPAFAVTASGSLSRGGDLNALAADQMTTLLDQTERFKVIERVQLKKLLDEQNLEGIVRPGELAKPGKVRGVDYLLLGKVTNLRVKRENKSTGFGLAKVGGLIGGADVKNEAVTITTECGVDIRFVDPTTGEIMTANFSEFKRTDEAKAMGLEILGASARADADLQFSEDDKGKILRLALDDALRKSLPKIDRFLRSQPARATADAGPADVAAPPAAPPAAAAAPAAAPAAAAVAAPAKSAPAAGDV
jgi:curli biogenesis system outer membrane secretion channel CsgG